MQRVRGIQGASLSTNMSCVDLTEEKNRSWSSISARIRRSQALVCAVTDKQVYLISNEVEFEESKQSFPKAYYYAVPKEMTN